MGRKPGRQKTDAWQRLAAWAAIIAMFAIALIEAGNVIAETYANGVHTPVDVWDKPDNGYPWAMVIASDVNFREGPGLNHRAVCQWSYGTAVEVLGEKNGWYSVFHWSHPGRVLWVWGEYLQMK